MIDRINLITRIELAITPATCSYGYATMVRCFVTFATLRFQYVNGLAYNTRKLRLDFSVDSLRLVVGLSVFWNKKSAIC